MMKSEILQIFKNRNYNKDWIKLKKKKNLVPLTAKLDMDSQNA